MGVQESAYIFSLPSFMIFTGFQKHMNMIKNIIRRDAKMLSIVLISNVNKDRSNDPRAFIGHLSHGFVQQDNRCKCHNWLGVGSKCV